MRSLTPAQVQGLSNAGRPCDFRSCLRGASPEALAGANDALVRGLIVLGRRCDFIPNGWHSAITEKGRWLLNLVVAVPGLVEG